MSASNQDNQVTTSNSTSSSPSQNRSHRVRSGSRRLEPKLNHIIVGSNTIVGASCRRQTGGWPQSNVGWQRSLFVAVTLGSVILASLVLLLSVSRPSHSIELHRRVKRALYDLPDGAELILGSNLRTTFTCDGLGYGYYADPDNDCKIFHICQSFKMSDGSIYNNHWSFMCGNQTVFNQVSLACSHPEDAIPCDNARDFYHVNDYFGDMKAPSVRDSDLVSAQDLVSRAYGSRLSSSNQ